MIKIATPISHLFKDPINVFEISRYSDCLECRDDSFDFIGGEQEVFHCDLQPIHKLNQDQFKYLEKIKNTKSRLKLISFHCASCCDNPVVDSHGVFQDGGLKYSRDEMLGNAKYNFSVIKKIFGADIEIAIENNNYYFSSAYEFIADPEFISSVVNDNNLGFLFDIAHAKVTCYNRKINFDDYKKNLPLDKIVQLHVCHYGINKNGSAYDAHDLPTSEEMEEVKNLINEFNVKYLTV